MCVLCVLMVSRDGLLLILDIGGDGGGVLLHGVAAVRERLGVARHSNGVIADDGERVERLHRIVADVLAAIDEHLLADGHAEVALHLLHHVAHNQIARPLHDHVLPLRAEHDLQLDDRLVDALCPRSSRK